MQLKKDASCKIQQKTVNSGETNKNKDSKATKPWDGWTELNKVNNVEKVWPLTLLIFFFLSIQDGVWWLQGQLWQGGDLQHDPWRPDGKHEAPLGGQHVWGQLDSWLDCWRMQELHRWEQLISVDPSCPLVDIICHSEDSSYPPLLIWLRSWWEKWW